MRGFQNGLIYRFIISDPGDIKFKKEVIFLGRFSPHEKPEGEDKKSNFWIFQIAF